MELNKTTLLYIAIPVGVLLLILIALYGFSSPQLGSSDLVMWGFEKPEVYDELLRNLQNSLPMKIKYEQKNTTNYEKELLNAMAAGQGPDIFPIHHTWLARYKDKLAPAPSDLMPIKTYNDTFVDVASQDFIADGNVWAAPFSVDTLALFWNKDFFNTNNIPEPPKNWDQFLDDVAKLTIKKDDGAISRAGAALGTARNVNSATDILYLLMLQTGAKMTNGQNLAASFGQETIVNGENYEAGKEALNWYTQFVFPQKTDSTSNPAYTWNPKMENSLESFYRGRAAMTIDYSSTINGISEKAPYLNFAIAPVPQVKNSSISVNYADYWGMAVWTGSNSEKSAWQAILWLSEKENAKKYLQQAQKPASRRDLISWQKDDPMLGVFANQSLSARSWYQVDNIAIKEIFAQAIESVVYGQASPKDAIDSAENKVTALMRESKN
jgi:ABC-type glycerol-3-phosphate transport system substrate-binding protein